MRITDPAAVRPRRRAAGRHVVRARGVARFRPQRARSAAAPRRRRDGGRRHPRARDGAHGARRPGGSIACSTSCTATAAAARTACCRDCSMRSACRTRAPACSARRCRWTRSAPSRCGSRSACRRRPTSACERGDDVVAAAHKIGLPVIVKPACEGSSVGVTPLLQGRGPAGGRRTRGALRGPAAGRAADPGRRVHGRRARQRGAAVDPHRAGGRVLRLPREVRRRGHAVPLPGLTGAAEQELGEPHARGVLRGRLQRLGSRRFHARPRRASRGCSRSTRRRA